MLDIYNELVKAKRPLIVAGHGIRLAKAQDIFTQLVEFLDIPVVTTFNGFDLMPTNSDNFIGRIGTLGSVAGNFALQNSDLIIFIGTRNNIRQVSYQWESFAKRAKKIIVDIDKAELNKKTVKGDILIHLDAGIFIDRLLDNRPKRFNTDKAWSKLCLLHKKKYPIVLPEYRKSSKDSVHPYHFIEELTKVMPDNAVAVADNGTACVVLFQAGIVKTGQRIFWNSGCASMGYGLPAAIGAALASNRQVVCLTGDGSLQMNIQELQTIKHHKLPIKIFVLNNGGYRSIEMTQAGFFDGNYIGCNKDSGVSFPDCHKISDAYGIKYFRLNSTKSMNAVIKNVLAFKGTVLCEVMLTKGYVFYPKISGKRMTDGKIVGGFE